MNHQPAASQRLLQALQDQAEIYEQLLERCDAPTILPEELAQLAEDSQQKAHQIGEQVTDVVARWCEISAGLEPEIRKEIIAARSRVHDSIYQILDRHQSLLGKFETGGGGALRQESDLLQKESIEVS